MLIGGIFILLIPSAPAAFDEAEDVEVISRTPDKLNPLYETDEVEGGVSFYVPKNTAFERKNGIISPVDPLEYFVKKINGVTEQIGSLSRRVDALERSSEAASEKNNQGSL